MLKQKGLWLSAGVVLLLAACNPQQDPAGGEVLTGIDGSSVTSATASGTVSVAQLQSGAYRLDSSDASAPFTAHLPGGIAAVSVDSPATVRFAMKDRAGNVVTGLQPEHLGFAIARLTPATVANFGVPGAGEPGQWVSYIYRSKSGSAVTDGVQATFENAGDGQLSYDAERKFYSYTFATDLQTATRPDDTALIWDQSAVHRVAIQLDLRDDAGDRILFNPHFDFTFDDGESTPLTDMSRTRKVVDESSCNECHGQLRAHGARVETEYCVMCHNPGSIDVEFGSVLDFKVMVHKIHKGRALQNPYQIMGFDDVIHDWSDVGYPQDLRNCNKCHDGADAATPQGDNWKKVPTQQACGSCHEDVDFNSHRGFDMVADDGALDNSRCGGCHAGQLLSRSAHFNQAQQHSTNYAFNILAWNYEPSDRSLNVTYSLTNPVSGDPYDLSEGLTDCIDDVNNGAAVANDCRDLEGASFSRLSLVIGALTVPGASPGIDDYSDNSVSMFAWQGAANGDGSYSASLQLPAGTVGTARLLSSGQAQERRVFDLSRYNFAQSAGVEIDQFNALANGVDWDWNNRVRVPIANAFLDFAADAAPLNTRRTVVADDNCNACHGLLGTASGSNTEANAFHRGERSSVNACPVCHTPNRALATEMTDEVTDSGIIEPLLPGTSTRMNQNFEFKNMIHGIHGGQIRVTPFKRNDDDLSGKTRYPNNVADCTACHDGQSYLASGGNLGAVVTSDEDPGARKVFSPYAAACAGCHDSAADRLHMSGSGVGGASVGDFTQAQWLSGQVYERCGECHGPGGGKDIARVHALQ